MPRKPKTAKKTTYSGKVKLREKALANGSRSLYLDCYANGKRSYEFLGLYLTGNRYDDTETLRVAEAKRSQRELELATTGTGIVTNHSKHESFLAFFDGIQKGRHPNYRATYGQVLSFSGGVLTFGALTPKLCEDFRDYLIKNKSNNTASGYFLLFKKIVRMAVDAGKLTSDPTAKLQVPKLEETTKAYLTVDELRTLQKTHIGNKEVGRAFMFSCFTGLRRSDIYSLTWEQITNGRIEKRIKKTGRIEFLPLSAMAIQILGEPRDSGKVFDLPALNTLQLAVIRWTRRAGINKAITFHSARHTFAMTLLANGADLYSVSKLLGHADIKTTTIYAKVLDEQKKRAVDLLPTL